MRHPLTQLPFFVECAFIHSESISDPGELVLPNAVTHSRFLSPGGAGTGYHTPGFAEPAGCSEPGGSLGSEVSEFIKSWVIRPVADPHRSAAQVAPAARRTRACAIFATHRLFGRVFPIGVRRLLARSISICIGRAFRSTTLPDVPPNHSLKRNRTYPRQLRPLLICVCSLASS